MSYASKTVNPFGRPHRISANHPPRVAAASAIRRKPVSLPMVVLALCLACGISNNRPAQAGADDVAASAQTSTYVFLPDQSTITQTGGIAGVNRTYTVEGSFQLSIDPNAAEAVFLRVDANATDDSDPRLTLDPNEVFALTTLPGMLTVSGAYIFRGRTSDGSSIDITLTFRDDLAHLSGETMPPPGSADFFLFSIEATARRKYGGGTGEPNSPYQIWTPEQMNAIGAEPNDWDKHFKLMADIDLSQYQGTEFNVIGDRIEGHNDYIDRPFRGVFDGNGHTISNFRYRSSDKGYIGLFGYVDAAGATIRNLGMIGPNLLHADNGSGTALLAGHPDSRAYMLLSFVADATGALVGHLGSGSVTGCYVAGGAVTGTYDVGGLAGHNFLGAVTQCYATCAVGGERFVGGLLGYNWGDVTNCTSGGRVDGQSDTGGLVGASREDRAVNCFWDVETSGQMASAGGTGKTTAEMQTAATFLDAGWDFVGETTNGTDDIWWIDEGLDYPRLWWEPLKYGGGTGAPRNPYRIYTAEHLHGIGAEPDDWDKHFKLMSDLDMSAYEGPDESQTVKPIGIYGQRPFSGHFDGNGHTISHLVIRETGLSPAGLFGFVRPLLVGDSPWSNEAVEVIRALGLIDPNVQSPSNIGVGALVGYLSHGNVSSCYVKGGTVKGANRAGGLIGAAPMHNMPTPHALCDCYVQHCDVQGYSPVGGLVGEFGDGRIDGCWSVAHVRGAQYVGGLVGQCEVWSGRDDLSRCWSSGTVEGTSEIGGLAGRWWGDGAITECYSTAAVQGGFASGGLVGMNADGTIVNCYAVGPVSGIFQVGGLVGANQGTINTCYAGGRGTGETEVGGLVGSMTAGPFQAESVVNSSFWDIDTSGQTTSAGGTGKTTAEMRTVLTFLTAGWDFVGEMANGTDDAWRIDEGQDYPRLWWELPVEQE